MQSGVAQQCGDYCLSGVFLRDIEARTYAPMVAVPQGVVETEQVHVTSIRRLMALAPTPIEGWYTLVDPGDRHRMLVRNRMYIGEHICMPPRTVGVFKTCDSGRVVVNTDNMDEYHDHEGQGLGVDDVDDDPAQPLAKRVKPSAHA